MKDSQLAKTLYGINKGKNDSLKFSIREEPLIDSECDGKYDLSDDDDKDDFTWLRNEEKINPKKAHSDTHFIIANTSRKPMKKGD